MGKETLAEANRRIEQSEALDLFDSDRLGLFVVSRLAARHGIKVHLRTSPYGGTTAVVLLPTPCSTPARRNVPAPPGGRGTAAERAYARVPGADTARTPYPERRTSGPPSWQPVPSAAEASAAARRKALRRPASTALRLAPTRGRHPWIGRTPTPGHGRPASPRSCAKRRPDEPAGVRGLRGRPSAPPSGTGPHGGVPRRLARGPAARRIPRSSGRRPPAAATGPSARAVRVRRRERHRQRHSPGLRIRHRQHEGDRA